MSFVVDYAKVDGNETPNLEAFKAAGGVGAIVRLTWGTLVDSTVARDRQRIEDADLTFGAYAYVRAPKPGAPVPRPKEQLRVACAALGKLHRANLPLTIDVEEDGSTLSPIQLHEWYHEAWRFSADEYGVAPIEYTSARYQREVLHDIPPGEMDQSPLWLAWYPIKERSPAVLDQSGFADPPIPAAWGDHDNAWLHQDQGDARGVPGFSSTVDVDRFRLLRQGARGDRVRWVQKRLPGVGVDGAFAGETARGLESFQRREGLEVDHVVGLRTFARLCWAGAERI